MLSFKNFLTEDGRRKPNKEKNEKIRKSFWKKDWEKKKHLFDKKTDDQKLIIRKTVPHLKPKNKNISEAVIKGSIRKRWEKIQQMPDNPPSNTPIIYQEKINQRRIKRSLKGIEKEEKKNLARDTK